MITTINSILSCSTDKRLRYDSIILLHVLLPTWNLNYLHTINQVGCANNIILWHTFNSVTQFERQSIYNNYFIKRNLFMCMDKTQPAQLTSLIKMCNLLLYSTKFSRAVNFTNFPVSLQNAKKISTK